MTAPMFVDISQFQPEPIDWQAYKAWSAQWDGIARVAMRSDYGAGLKDASFDAHRANALNAGIDQIIYYHYCYPQLNSPVAEANSQFSFVGSIRPQDLLALDIEENVLAANSAWAYQWLAQQESNYKGKLPRIYASSAYIQARLQDARLARYPLWLANWQFTPDERPACPSPWTSYELVQYTDRATVPGIGENVDCNIFLGVEPQPEEQPVSIDLTNGAVAQFFSGNASQWTCKNGFTLHGEILAFYQQYGGNALCGLTHLGLPLSNELPVPDHPGVVNQLFERGAVRFDPNHELSNPPGSGRVYLIQTKEDPRTVALQAQITQLENLPIVANMQQITAIGQSIQSDVAAIMKLAGVQ